MNRETEQMFNAMPDEMKTATVRYRAAYQRMNKAKDQAGLWEREFQDAHSEFRIEEKSYGRVSMRWNPTTNTMDSTDLEEFKEPTP